MTEINNRLSKAKIEAISEQVKGQGIGGLSERSLHRIIKLYIEPDPTLHEVPFMGSIADVKNEDGIFEVQTRSVHRLLPKLRRFLEYSKVTVVLPVAQNKRLKYLDVESGEIIAEKKSPKKETVYTALASLYGIRELLKNPRLSVRILLLSVDEYKAVKKTTDLKKAVKLDRFPTEVISDLTLSIPDDYIQFVPNFAREEIMSRDVADALRLKKDSASNLIGVFYSLGLFIREGRVGNAYVYKRNPKLK